jgi:hypothetical protein
MSLSEVGKLIPPEDQIFSKTYMTQMEGGNTQLELSGKTFSPDALLLYIVQMLSYSIRLLLHYPAMSSR